jgi:hypothetical protein
VQLLLASSATRSAKLRLRAVLYSDTSHCGVLVAEAAGHEFRVLALLEQYCSGMQAQSMHQHTPHSLRPKRVQVKALVLTGAFSIVENYL